jgi:choice-of-anchor A domain-containing protein
LANDEIDDLTTTITGNGGENVINLTQVNITSPSSNITITGTPNDTFIFRVAGDFNVGNGTIRAAGGVTPNHILWYFPNTSNIKSPNGSWDGTILALNSPIQLDNTPSGLGPIRGAIIASDDVNNNQPWVFSTVSGLDLNAAPFQTVPEPATLGVLSCVAAVALSRRRPRPA